MVRVGDVAMQVRGVSYAKEDASSVALPGYLPILRAGNITDNGLVFDELVFVPSKRISSVQKVRRHDVVVAASSGSLDVVGKAAPAASDFEGGFGAFCKVLRPTEKIDPRYFAQFFKTQDYRNRASSLAAGININNLRNEHLDDMRIPLPPIAEQQRIAAILVQADELRAKRRATLVKMDTLIESIFLNTFDDPVLNSKGWPRVPFGELLERIDSGWSPICLDRPVTGNEWGVLKLGSVTRCEYDPSENKALPPDQEPDAELEIQPGDLLFSRKNTHELVAACALVKT